MDNNISLNIVFELSKNTFKTAKEIKINVIIFKVSVKFKLNGLCVICGLQVHPIFIFIYLII